MLLYQADNRFSFTKRKQLNFPLHLQEMVEIVFVIHGSCQIRCGDLHTQLQGGDVLVVFPNVLHEYRQPGYGGLCPHRADKGIFV